MTQPKLLDRVRAEIRNRRFSYRTGQTKEIRGQCSKPGKGVVALKPSLT